MKKFITNKGFAMVEILVATSIITAAFLFSMAVAQKSIYLARQATHQIQAAMLLEEGAEAVRIVRDNAWTNISSLTSGTNYYPTFSNGTWTLSTTSNTVGIFTRKVTLASVNRNLTSGDIVISGGTADNYTKKITVTVSWPQGGQTITKTMMFYLLNIF